MRQLYSCSNYVLEIANSNFPLLFSILSPDQCVFSSSDLIILVFSVVARNFSMTCLFRNFEKLDITPNSRVKRFLKVKLSNMTDWHILPGHNIDVLIACRRLSVSSQKVECVSRYSASGN